jgi:hypothetical protein
MYFDAASNDLLRQGVQCVITVKARYLRVSGFSVVVIDAVIEAC